jgi:hypothetical protein
MSLAIDRVTSARRAIRPTSTLLRHFRELGLVGR